METKNTNEFCERIRRAVGMDKSFYIPPINIGRGLGLWWKVDTSVEILHHDKNIIDFKVTIPNLASNIFITLVYGDLEFNNRLRNWESLMRI